MRALCGRIEVGGPTGKGSEKLRVRGWWILHTCLDHGFGCARKVEVGNEGSDKLVTTEFTTPVFLPFMTTFPYLSYSKFIQNISCFTVSFIIQGLQNSSGAII